MSLFKRLFSTDPAALLEKAEAALGRGAPVDALALLARLPDAAPAEMRERHDALEARAREAVTRAALERATSYEEAGMTEQAVDSLAVALENCRDAAVRASIGERLARLTSDEASAHAGPPDDGGEDEEPWEDGADAAFARLVAMLREDVASRYDDRPDAFRQAYVDLNEGRAAEALPVFDQLVREAPDDPVGRLERGRCLLLLGRSEEARADLEAAWEGLGDEPLDAPGALSVPLLWAEAAADLSDHEALVERLSGPGGADGGQPALSHVLALSLIALGRRDEAAGLLQRCTAAFPREPAFPHLLASVLADLGEAGQAIAVLERAIAPGCSSGGCGTPALHVPSLRLLASLHLDEGDAAEEPGEAAERARELVSLVAGRQGGRLDGVDHVLLARIHRQLGEEVEVAKATARARALLPPDAADLRKQLEALETVGGG